MSTYSIDLTDAIMTNIVGQNSMIGMINTNLRMAILDGPFNQKGFVDPVQMIRIQWGDSSFLSDSAIALQDVPFIPSIGDPDFDDAFITYPEFGVYC